MSATPGQPEGGRDTVVGRRALEKGWVTPEQLRQALYEQWSEVESGKSDPRTLVEVLAARAILTPQQLDELQRGLPPPAPLYPPFGRYLLRREIGRGPMGVVYEAEDPCGEKVAVKILAATASEHVDHDRFFREAEAMKKVPPHPGLVRVLEAGVIEGRRYLATERVEGVSFSEWRRQGSLTVRRQIAVLRDAALALHHAHQHGVLHRDLKPENIIVDQEHRARITDFGLARLAATLNPPTGTSTRIWMGATEYMSPEQIQNGAVDRRSDLYALGVMLYEILAGRRPFQGGSAYDEMTRSVEEPPPPPSRITRLQVNPLVFRNVENICLIALAKNPANRYPDAAAFARDLTAWLEDENRRVVAPASWRRWRARKIIPRLLAGLAAAALIGAAAGWAAMAWNRSGLDRAALPALPLAPEKLRAGAVAEYFTGLNRNSLGLRAVDTRAAFDDPSRPLWPEHHGYWTSRRWTGYLRVPETAVYVFEMRAEETARLYIDGQELASSGAAVPAARTLQRGYHGLRIEHAHRGQRDTVVVSWNRQGEPAMARLGPGSLFHEPSTFVPVIPDRKTRFGMDPVRGAQEGEKLPVLLDSGHPPEVTSYEKEGPFWRGSWSGADYLWWGRSVTAGNRLKLRFAAPRAGPGALVLGLTRGSDHGIFRVRVNGTAIIDRLDLYSPDLVTGPTEVRDVPLRTGDNELEFEVTGSHADAREWGAGGGVYKLGLDYVLVP